MSLSGQAKQPSSNWSNEPSKEQNFSDPQTSPVEAQNWDQPTAQRHQNSWGNADHHVRIFLNPMHDQFIQVPFFRDQVATLTKESNLHQWVGTIRQMITPAFGVTSKPRILPFQV